MECSVVMGSILSETCIFIVFKIGQWLPKIKASPRIERTISACQAISIG